MTDAQRLIAVKELIAKYTASNVSSEADARKCLIKEGIYTKDGHLRVEFGGERRKKAKAAA